MLYQISRGLILTCLLLPAGIAAQDELMPHRHLNRAKLAESMWNTGAQGGIAPGGNEPGQNSNSMHYPYVFAGRWSGTVINDASYSDGRSSDNDNALGSGVWVVAKDAQGKAYVTFSGPHQLSQDVVPLGANLAPGGSLKLRNLQDHPFVEAEIGYDAAYANVWNRSDRGGSPRTQPVSGEPLEIANYRANGMYTQPQLDHFPEEIIVSRWMSNETGEGTGVTITRYAYAWSNPDFDDFFIVELVAENTSSRDYEEVYMGYMVSLNVSRPGHSIEHWAGGYDLRRQHIIADDRYQFTEAPNYTGPYRGWHVSYEYDGDNPRNGYDDLGQPFALSRRSESWMNPNRPEGELLSPQYIGWGPVDLTPPFINDPETYVPITGTGAGGPDLPGDQPRYTRWWMQRLLSPEFEPSPVYDTAEGMWNKLINLGEPIQNNPVDGGPGVLEESLQKQIHTQMYGPWRLMRGEKAKIVLVFAAGMASEIAGPGGEPMDERLWAMSPGARSQLSRGEEVLFDHIARARQLYAMGYDLPNQPPDVPSLSRTDTNRSLKLENSKSGRIVLSWTDGAEQATHPDYTGSEAQDVAGYRIYGTTSLRQTAPAPHAGTITGPWRLIADIRAKDPAYYENGMYQFEDESSLPGFNYWYTLATYARGHEDWENINAQNNVIPGAQQPAAARLADLPEVVQRHVKAGYESSHLVDEARNADNGQWFSPAVAAQQEYDLLQDEVLVVPNPWKDDGVHSYGTRGANDKKIRFINIPRLARISVFNAAGDLVVQIVHDGTRAAQHVAEVDWTQTTRSGTGVAPGGIYYFAVESLVPGGNDRVRTGSFVIVQ